MRLGFTSIYSSRPHVAQMHYLAQLARQAGHEVRFLTCASDLPACYNHMLRPGRPRLVECATCRIGNIRSYDAAGISSIGSLAYGPQAPPESKEWAFSSASTLGRFESDQDYASKDFAILANTLQPGAALTYSAARAWIAREKLDGVFLYNGRMDATRAVLEAAKDAGVPFVTMERTWFGDGIQLFPNENCIGLKNTDAMVEEWRDRPLLREQTLKAAPIIAARFLRRNQKEWRAYNVNATQTPWPVEESRHRLLLLPGSRNEIWGHEDWRENWPERTAALDALIDHFKLAPQDVVLRCHPYWAENVGQRSGVRVENYYADWAKKRGILCIPAKSTTSTMALIEEADAIALPGGSAAIEASALGKQIFGLSPAIYQKAGFQERVYEAQDLENLQFDKDKTPAEQKALARMRQRQILRFCYTVSHRLVQFVPFVRCVTTTNFNFFEGADATRLTRMLQTGKLEADDDRYAPNESEENEILDLMAAKEWEKLIESPPYPHSSVLPIHRRHIYQAVDWVRDRMPRGDL